MQETTENTIVQCLKNQRTFFNSKHTKDISFRLQQLNKLKKVILENRIKIEHALWEDLHKSPEEAYITEISIVLSEINMHIKQLKRWAKPKSVSTPIYLFPSTSKIRYEPLGVALLIAPWNYPFQLLINPLIGAISSGCCSILKPSPDAPAVARLIEELIAHTFYPEYVSVIQGGRETNTTLLASRFDIIFFTGSPKVGKVVMAAAAKNLTPVILELGGKSPCIVDVNANLDIAAKRIAWGKFLNAGQTCIAPDYLLAHKSIKEELLNKIAAQIETMYGKEIKESRFYPRIINKEALERLARLLSQGTIHTGGIVDKEDKFITPTILDNIKPNFLIMQEEIFGPILPVITFGHIEETINHINKNEKPLALYYFGKKHNAQKVLDNTSSGGACINDTILHVGNHHLPFGGVGNSGMGAYHGYNSFLAFSHKKAIVTSPTCIDLPLKYAPFKYFKFIKRII